MKKFLPPLVLGLICVFGFLGPIDASAQSTNPSEYFNNPDSTLSAGFDSLISKTFKEVPSEDEIYTLIESAQVLIQNYKIDLEELTEDQLDFVTTRMQALINQVDGNTLFIDGFLKAAGRANLNYILTPRLTVLNDVLRIEMLISNTGKPFFLGDASFNLVIRNYNESDQTPIQLTETYRNPQFDGVYTSQNSNDYDEMSAGFNQAKGFVTYQINLGKDEVYEELQGLPVRTNLVNNIRFIGEEVPSGVSIIGAVEIPIIQSAGKVYVSFDKSSYMYQSKPLYQNIYNEFKALSSNVNLGSIQITSSNVGELCYGENVTFTSNRHGGNQWQITNALGEWVDVVGVKDRAYSTDSLKDGQKVRVSTPFGDDGNGGFTTHFSNEISHAIITLSAAIDEVGPACVNGNIEYTASYGNGDSYLWEVIAPESAFSLNNGLANETLDLNWIDAGTFKVAFTHFSSNSALSCDPISDTITQVINPTVTAIINPAFDLCENGSQTYSAVVSESGDEYSWSFSGEEGIDFQYENSTNQNSTNPEITWLTNGIKTINLTVSNVLTGDQCGPAIAEAVSHVVNETTNAVINETVSLCETGIDTLKASVVNVDNYNWTISGVGNVDWEFTSGTNAASAQPIVKWLQANEYSIGLSLTNSNSGSNCNDFSATGVTQLVNSAVTVELIQIADVCQTGEVIYTANTQFANAFSWNISGTESEDYEYLDGTDSTSESPKLLWHSEGIYNIFLAVTNEESGFGCNVSVSETLQQTVNSSLVSSLNPIDSICQTGDITYSATTENAGKYSWSISGIVNEDYVFINGTNDNSVSPQVNWISEGEFGIGALVTNVNSGSGCTSLIIGDSSQKVYPSVSVQIDPIEELCNTGSRNYSATVQNGIGYIWTVVAEESDYSFENETTASSKEIELTWLSTGEYTLSLEVANVFDFEGCTPRSDTVYQRVNNKATATLNPSVEVCETGEVIYSANVNFGDAYTWSLISGGSDDFEFVNGTNSNSESPNIKWLKAGIYDVNLIVTSLSQGAGCDNAEDTISQNVNETATVVIDSVSDVCEGGELFFSAQVEYGENGLWSFGGSNAGEFVNSTNDSSATPNRKYTQKGNAWANLVVETIYEGAGCIDAISDTVYFDVHEAPYAYITPLNLRCLGDAVAYSVQLGHTEGSTFEWGISGIENTDYSFLPGYNNTGDTTIVVWNAADTSEIVLIATGPNPGVFCVASNPDTLTQIIRTISVSINPVDVIEIGDTIELVPVAAISDGDPTNIIYSWSSDVNNSEIVDSTASNAFVRPMINNTTYTLKVDNGEGCFASAQIQTPVNIFVQADLKVMLEGAFFAAGDSMKNELRTGETDYLSEQYGYVSPTDLLALIDREIFGIGDNPRMDQGFNVPQTAVDIVEISLRATSNGAKISHKISANADSLIETQLAWLLTDGSLTDFKTGAQDGLRFYNQELGHQNSYHVVVKHRNHLAVMSVLLPINFETGAVNLSDSVANIFGSVTSLSKIGNVYTMPAGDVDNNQKINVDDRNNTRTDSQRGEDGYRSSNGLSTDANLSGRVNADDLNLVEKNLPRQLTSTVPNP